MFKKFVVILCVVFSTFSAQAKECSTNDIQTTAIAAGAVVGVVVAGVTAVTLSPAYIGPLAAGSGLVYATTPQLIGLSVIAGSVYGMGTYVLTATAQVGSCLAQGSKFVGEKVKSVL
jgi:hypothetical protein